MPTTNNPFNISNTLPGANNLQAAVNSSAAPESTGYDAATAGATGFNETTTGSTGYNAANMNAQGYTGAQGNLNNWNVGNDQTVQGQLKGILESNSPLLQQAKTAALADMNKRGLVNSSMAVGAGYDAMVKNALPIAQQDAQTNAQAAQTNAAAANNMSQFNTGQTNTANQFNATQQNQAASQNQNAQNTAAQFGANASNQAAQFNAQVANNADQFTASAKNTADLANAQAQNNAAQFTANSANTASLNYSQQLNAQVAKQMDQALAVATANGSAANTLQLQELGDQTKKDLAATEAAYKVQMQASQSSNEIFQQVSKNIADIMANPDITDAIAKQNAIDAQKKYLTNALNLLSATSGIKTTTGQTLGDLLSF